MSTPSDHDAFDLVERDRVRRPVVQLRRPGRRMAGNLLRVLERSPFDRYAVMPVARNVWQHVDASNPAPAARRLIIDSTTRRVSDRPLRRPDRSTLWNNGVFASSTPPATRYASTVSSAR